MAFTCEYFRNGVPRHSGRSRQRREGEMLREEVGRSQGQARRGTVAMVVPGKRGVGTVAYQPSSSGQNFLTVELGRCIVGSLRRISLSGWRCLWLRSTTSSKRQMAPLVWVEAVEDIVTAKKRLISLASDGYRIWDSTRQQFIEPNGRLRLDMSVGFRHRLQNESFSRRLRSVYAARADAQGCVCLD